MNPTVVAAVIAASVSGLTLIGTLAAQYFGRRATSRELDRTLGEQRTRTLNERFSTAADKLGSDKPPAVRLAGVYAMGGLADDWEENRQTCIDVLCAYLRIPGESPPDGHADSSKRLRYEADLEVRHTVIRVITAHLRGDAKNSWRGYDLDFTGVVFDGGDFHRARFIKSKVSFRGARFCGGRVSFEHAVFDGSHISFRNAEFSCPCRVSFRDAQFINGEVGFPDAEFSGGQIYFPDARFCGGKVSFRRTKFTKSEVSFRRASFTEGGLGFEEAEFSGGKVDFHRATFGGGKVSFRGAAFRGGEVSFSLAKFSGGEVDFTNPGDWSVPPTFPWAGTPPRGVTLPREEDQS
jgi:uncharacterized protein YjbI with pentapeptide repeats